MASGVPLPASFASSHYVPGTITGHGDRVNGVKPVPSSMCWWEEDLPQECHETQLQGEVSAMQRTQQGKVGWERGHHRGETENRGLDCVGEEPSFEGTVWTKAGGGDVAAASVRWGGGGRRG